MKTPPIPAYAKVVAIINLAISAISLLWTLVAALLRSLLEHTFKPPSIAENPLQKAIAQAFPETLWTGTGTLLTVLVLLGAILFLSRVSLGRTLLLWVSLGKLLLSVLSLLLFAVYLLPVVQPDQVTLVIVMAALMLGVVLFSSVLPLINLFVFNRLDVQASFRR